MAKNGHFCHFSYFWSFPNPINIGQIRRLNSRTGKNGPSKTPKPDFDPPKRPLRVKNAKNVLLIPPYKHFWYIFKTKNAFVRNFHEISENSRVEIRKKCPLRILALFVTKNGKNTKTQNILNHISGHFLSHMIFPKSEKNFRKSFHFFLKFHLSEKFEVTSNYGQQSYVT